MAIILKENKLLFICRGFSFKFRIFISIFLILFFLIIFYFGFYKVLNDIVNSLEQEFIKEECCFRKINLENRKLDLVLDCESSNKLKKVNTKKVERVPVFADKTKIINNEIKEDLRLEGIAEYSGEFGAVISSGNSSVVVFVGDKFQNYKVSCINKDYIVLNSSDGNEKLNLVLTS